METKKCAYCGKENDQSEMIQNKLVFRDRDRFTGKRFVNHKMNWYCMDKDCAMNDQFSHEG